MVVNQRKKNTRQRAKTTHGWGSMKKHRGKGNKGGAGMAGTGKRGDAKKPSIWKRKYFGKFGFKKKGQAADVNALTLYQLNEKIEQLVAQDKVTKKEDTFIIDLNSFGYNKLLGSGVMSKKVNVTVDSASESAKSKINKAGGEVITKKEE